jgi:hypothetical protein
MTANFRRNRVEDSWEKKLPTQKAAPERAIIGVLFAFYLTGQKVRELDWITPKCKVLLLLSNSVVIFIDFP